MRVLLGSFRPRYFEEPRCVYFRDFFIPALMYMYTEFIGN